jgi:lipoprotein Spr
MKFNKIIYLILFGIAGLILLSGCSATTSSSRFKEKKDTTQENYTSRYDKEWDLIEDDTSSFLGEDEEEFEGYTGENKVDLSEVMKKYSGTEPGSELETSKEKLLMEIIRYLDTPYKYGGNSNKGIDCSAFTQTIFNNCFAILLLRSARDQYTQGTEIENKEDLKFGDLVFFNTRRRVRPGHVGVYIGDDLFAHASSSYGVRISSLQEDYYSKRFMGGRRLDEFSTAK